MSALCSAIGFQSPSTAALFTIACNAPNLVAAVSTRRRTSSSRLHIAGDEHRFAAGATNRIDHDLTFAFVDVAEHHARARFGERLRGGATHARCSAGDDGDATAEIETAVHRAASSANSGLPAA